MLCGKVYLLNISNTDREYNIYKDATIEVTLNFSVSTWQLGNS